MRSPRVRAITFPSSICHIYIMGFGQYWTLLCMASSSVPSCHICDFCTSDRGFASGFLQIPPRDGHPCLQLTVPAAKPVADFRRLVIAHAGRTTTKKTVQANVGLNGLLALCLRPQLKRSFTAPSRTAAA
ncbi:hypothetical protein GK047_28655 [Paenibacillus sp. SYP-B3998]|uniref:Uncharacterized protein n=1 Tax=Paenibacillus sp. SYP-B3998 TaxID=2678564 RepID=A0A6G4A648_9BACL|nr:hypothetical protein [Paenibacillus sp. SYP-B3998]NEW09875.1 hypothetical protein [Paenibacillus sp. SYP-B3998]